MSEQYGSLIGRTVTPDGDLHGFKLTSRKSVKVCDIEVA